MTDQPTRAEGAADPEISVRVLQDGGHTHGGMVQVIFSVPWVHGKGYVGGETALHRAHAYAAALAADPHRQGVDR